MTDRPTPAPPEPPREPSSADPIVAAVEKATEPGEGAVEEPERVLLHMPVDVRSFSLAVLALLACTAALHLAAAVFIPLMLSLLLTYALAPAVDRLARAGLSRPLASGALLLALVGAIGWVGWSLSDDASGMIEQLPTAAQKVRGALRERAQRAPGPLDKVQQAATQLEQAAEESAATAPAVNKRGVLRVQVEPVRFDIKSYLLSGTLGLLGGIGQATIVLFMTFFALASGDTFRRKIVHIVGPSLSKKKVTVQVLDEITEQIKLYLLVQLATGVLVGLLTWIVYWALGLEYAAVWGIAAGVFNIVPYVGSVAITGATALMAFLQFGTLNMALLLGGASLVIHTITGYLVTPWLTSRTARMNPVSMFVGLLAWSWLWGVWGLLLGIPIMMVIKAICDRVEDLKPIGELLGD